MTEAKAKKASKPKVKVEGGEAFEKIDEPRFSQDEPSDAEIRAMMTTLHEVDDHGLFRRTSQKYELARLVLLAARN